MLVVGIDDARSARRAVHPADTALDVHAFAFVIVPVRGTIADTFTAFFIPVFVFAASSSNAAFSFLAPDLVIFAGGASINAAPVAVGPDLIFVAKTFRWRPSGNLLASTLSRALGVASHSLLTRVSGALIEVSEAAASILEPGSEVTGCAFFLVARSFLPEAAAPVVSPVAFFLRKTLESIAIVLVQEASARSLVPAGLHGPWAFLL